MDKNVGILTTLVVIAVVIGVVQFFVFSGNGVDQAKLTDDVTTGVVNALPEAPVVPTADEIATAVADKFVMPEYTPGEKEQEIWEKLYESDIEEIEDEAYDVAYDEVRDNQYHALEKWLKANIEGFDEMGTVTFVDDDTTVTQLGLNEDEDKEATVEFELSVEYTLKEGLVGDYKKTVMATADVLFVEGDYTDEEVEVVYA